MNAKKNKGLGKGLSALFGDQKNPENTNKIEETVQKALIGELARNKYQPRSIFDEKKLTELSQSIKKNGIIQPIAVRKNKSSSEPYEIVAGERRWLAAQKAGLHEVPITILDLNDSETLEVAIVENIQREDLNIIEEAKGYKRLNEEFGYDQDKIAVMMSRSRSHISNTLRLLNLPKDIIAMLEQGELTAGQARPLIGMPNASSIAEEIVAKKLSARSIEGIKKKNAKSFTIDPNIFDAQRDIERSIGLKVTINNKKNNSGKLTIEYKNLEQLELLSTLLKNKSKN
jgi:ParB family chromosome partitioning protein